MSLTPDNLFGMHTQALDLWQRRSEVLANNLANADTPNYLARDIDFRKALSAASGQQEALPLSAPSPGQIDPVAQSVQQLAYRNPTQPSMDGNTVDEQAEQANFAANGVHYQASLAFITAQVHMLRTAITGGPELMSLFSIFNVAGSGMTAQSLRLNTVASNLANADSVASTPEAAYRSREPLFAAVQKQLGSSDNAGEGVQVLGITESQAAIPSHYEPDSPLADADGNVYASNVNPIDELVNMISASRSYQNNVEVMNTTKQLMLKTLDLGK